jgi:tripartite-type tricarboxylate transporter receptor subunit TctC
MSKFLVRSLSSLSILFLTLSPLSIQAQSNWPSKPIKIIVPFPPGGSTDILARIYSQRLSENLAQSVIVENRAGANGVVAASSIAKGALDDHTFLVVSMPMLAVNQFIYTKLGYDPDQDFSSIGLLAQTPNVIVVNPSLGINTLTELTSYAKSHPDKTTYSGATGSTGFLLSELYKSKAGITALHIPYKGNALAMQAVLAGDVQFTTDNLPQLLPQIRAGKLKPLAIIATKRWSQLPEVPTATEFGYPSMTTSTWFGLVAQSKVAPSVIARMNKETNAILNRPDFKEKLLEVSFEPMPGSPEDMTLAVKKERAIWGTLIPQIGIKPE